MPVILFVSFITFKTAKLHDKNCLNDLKITFKNVGYMWSWNKKVTFKFLCASAGISSSNN